MLRELWRRSCGCWRYLQLADPAKIGKETTNLQSLTKKVVRVCAHSGKAVKPRCFLSPSLHGTSGGKFPAKTLSCGMRFCSEKGPLQSSTKSRAERIFVPRNNPSKALQSPERLRAPDVLLGLHA